MPRQQQLFRILMSDGMRLAREGRINLLERMGSSRPRFEEFMHRLIEAGSLRDGDPELLVMQFIGPLLFWRQLHAIGAQHRRTSATAARLRAHMSISFSTAPSRRRPLLGSRARRARTA